MRDFPPDFMTSYFFHALTFLNEVKFSTNSYGFLSPSVEGHEQVGFKSDL